MRQVGSILWKAGPWRLWRAITPKRVLSRRFTSAIKRKRLNLEIRIEFSIIRHVSAIGVVFITVRDSVYNHSDENADCRNGIKWDSVDIARELSSSDIKIFRQNSAVKRVLDWCAVARITQMRRDKPRAVEWRKSRNDESRIHDPKAAPHVSQLHRISIIRLWHIIRRYLWNWKLLCLVRKSFSMSVQDKFSRHFKSSAGSCASWPRKIHVMWTNRQTSRPITPELSPLSFTPV